MAIFNNPTPIPPGPGAKHSPGREGDTLKALSEVKTIVERLVQALDPFEPTTITDDDGQILSVLAQKLGVAQVGPRLHNVADLGAVVPDPVKITSQVFDDVKTAVLAAMPTSDAISGVISAILSASATSGTAPTSVESAIVGLFTGALGVIDTIPGLVAARLAGGTSIGDALTAYFATAGTPRPKSGDYIYTEATGIVYTIFPQQAGGIPSPNLIFRVAFAVGDKTWMALTTFPAPDIGALVESITGMALEFLQALIGAVVDGIVQAAGAALAALWALLDALQSTVDDILDQLVDLLSRIQDLEDWKEYVDTTLANIWAAIDEIHDLIDAMQAILDAATEVDVIGPAGDKFTIKVLTSGDGIDVRTDIAWIDSDAGTVKTGKAIVWTPETSTTYKFQTFYWLGQDGSHWAATGLLKNSDGYPKIEDAPGPPTPGGATGPLFSPEERDLCADDGSSETKNLLLADES